MRAHVHADAAARDDLRCSPRRCTPCSLDGFEFGLGVACAEDRERLRTCARCSDDLRRADRAGRRGRRAPPARRVRSPPTRARAERTRLEADCARSAAGAGLRRERGRPPGGRRRRSGRVRPRPASTRPDATSSPAETRAARRRRARDAERRAARAQTGGDAASGGHRLGGVAARRTRSRRTRSARPEAGRPARPGAARPAAPTCAARASGSGDPGSPATETGRRTAVPCPPGLRADQPEGLDAMLRTRGVVLVVNGYNVVREDDAPSSAHEVKDGMVSREYPYSPT